MAILRLTTLVLLLCACGTGAAPAGGSDHLPTSGGGPYGAPSNDPATPAEEPYVVVETGFHLSDPAALAQGGGYDLWFTRRAASEPPGPASIAHARIADTTELPDAPPLVVLEASEAWEQGEVAAPSVVEADDGSLVMYYQGGGTAAPAIGRATSSDGGRTWTKGGMVLADAVDPSALVVDGRVFLYVGRPDGSGLDVAESDDGLTFGAPVPVLAPRPGLVEAFDQMAVGQPDAVGGRTTTGQLVVGLFYTGTAQNGVTAIGHARSPDGRMFVRFFGGEAVLDALTPAESGPSAVLFADRGVLFVALERGGRSAIAAALHP